MNPVALKIQNNGHSLNPKKNPAMRRRFNQISKLPHITLGTFAMKPKRTPMGTIVEGRFVRVWGGRKPSRYDPNIENAKHAKAQQAAA
jgi:hypothetical protein